MVYKYIFKMSKIMTNTEYWAKDINNKKKSDIIIGGKFPIASVQIKVWNSNGTGVQWSCRANG